MTEGTTSTNVAECKNDPLALLHNGASLQGLYHSDIRNYITPNLESSQDNSSDMFYPAPGFTAHSSVVYNVFDQNLWNGDQTFDG